MLTTRELTTDADLTAAYAVMVQLRPHLPAGEPFVAIVRSQQRDGYVLLGGFADDGRLVALAGVRSARTLSRGPHLFVDDLVTESSARGGGHGTAMLRAVARYANTLGMPRLFLDSRDTALGFYRQVGFEPLTATPCVIDVAALL